MSIRCAVNENLSDAGKYESLLAQIEALLDSEEPIISNLANVTAALRAAFDKISWAGFYLVKEQNLFLGPFQGNVACTAIGLGKGVCGSSALKNETIIVDDVDRFPGHIACEAGTRSEIVVPLSDGTNVFGVLDLDSYRYSSFNMTDKLYLEKLCKLLTQKLPFKNLVL